MISTPRERWRSIAEWTREANRSPAGTVGADDLGEMLDVLGLRTLLQTERAEVPAAALALRDAREQARRERDLRGRRPAARRASRARLGGP